MAQIWHRRFRVGNPARALPQAQCKILAQWVEIEANAGSSVRVISDDACPSVMFDGTPFQMNVRLPRLYGVESRRVRLTALGHDVPWVKA